jgi:hypothetical protein
MYRNAMTENPCFHDALLTGVSLEDRRAIFAIDHVDGGKWRVVVNDVQALQIDEFREGNIISYFEVVTGTVPPAKCWSVCSRHRILMPQKSITMLIQSC